MKSEAQIAECKGWRDISNDTGLNPVERILTDIDQAQKVHFPDFHVVVDWAPS